MRRRNVLWCVENGTCAKFGVKMFVQVQDMAVNVLYYAMVPGSDRIQGGGL